MTMNMLVSCVFRYLNNCIITFLKFIDALKECLVRIQLAKNSQADRCLNEIPDLFFQMDVVIRIPSFANFFAFADNLFE